MLMVVLGHTISGCVTEYSDTILFQAIWTLQMPLFIIISGYVTRYSHPINNGVELWRFVKKRTLAYLLPWFIWSIIVRGMVFGQSSFLDFKYILWHMDSSYWFLATIWTISMIYGVADLLSNKWFKDKVTNVLSHLAISGLGLIGLAAVGHFVGMSFFAIKLTLYYLPIYLIGYFYGQIQDWMKSIKNANNIINFVIIVSLGLWLSSISRIDFFSGIDSSFMIIGRFITSILGCMAIIGLISGICNDIADKSKQQVAELSVAYETKVESFFKWVGVHSLEVYLIHGFSLCLLKMTETPALRSISGLVLTFSNFVIAVLLSCIYIKIIEKNNLLNKILYWK